MTVRLSVLHILDISLAKEMAYRKRIDFKSLTGHP
jgi:hypothetical protein